MPLLRETTKNSPTRPDQKRITNDALELLKRDFPSHCRNLRVNAGYSMAKLAHLLGIGDTADNSNARGKIAISRWEAGTHVPQKRYLLKFMQLQRAYDEGKKKN